LTSKKWAILAAVITLLLTGAMPASAGAPYESYNYNFYRDAVPGPAPYMPETTITGTSLGIGGFADPQDIYTSEDRGSIFVADTGNKRVVEFSVAGKLKRVIDKFECNGQTDGFSAPNGLFVDDKGQLYVADTENRRVVVLAADGKLMKIVESPKSDILPTNFEFLPLKVTVDQAGRIYVVARGVFEGIMQFDEKGQFIGFVGTNKIQRDVMDYFWRKISTKAQREQMMLYIPTEFSNVDIDSKGFVYATNIDAGSESPIKRLNPSGEDVLKRFGYFAVRGDIRFFQLGNNAGPSKLVDIKVLGNGMYSALDLLRGRIFTYTDEGDLLYIFGAKSNQEGTFKTPAAIEKYGDRILVLDAGKSNVVVFEPTAFGRNVNQAVKHHYNGDDQKSVEIWREVLRLNANYDNAYIGIGKALLMEKRNKEAIEYFELGMDRKNYSVAFKRYRREVAKEHFGTFMTVLMLAVLALSAWKAAGQWKKRRGQRREAGLS
jgi:hypothetical protein